MMVWVVVAGQGSRRLGLRRPVGPGPVGQTSSVAILNVEVQLEQPHQAVNGGVGCRGVILRLAERGREGLRRSKVGWVVVPFL